MLSTQAMLLRHVSQISQRIRHARRDEILRRVRLGAEADDSGRWQALCLLDVARPEVRRGAQLWVTVNAAAYGNEVSAPPEPISYGF